VTARGFSHRRPAFATNAKSSPHRWGLVWLLPEE
jgi:hypothetical protein